VDTKAKRTAYSIIGVVLIVIAAYWVHTCRQDARDFDAANRAAKSDGWNAKYIPSVIDAEVFHAIPDAAPVEEDEQPGVQPTDAEIAELQISMDRAEIQGTTNGILNELGLTGLAKQNGDVLEIWTSPQQSCRQTTLTKIKRALVRQKKQVRLFKTLLCHWTNESLSTR
jgi:hypothetical protein